MSAWRDENQTHTHTNMLETIELNDIENLHFWVADSLQPPGIVNKCKLKLLGSKRAPFEIKTESKTQVYNDILFHMYMDTKADTQQQKDCLMVP